MASLTGTQRKHLRRYNRSIWKKHPVAVTVNEIKAIPYRIRMHWREWRK